MHAMAVGQERAELIQGYAAMAVEVGSANRTVIQLLRAGLNSREAATTAVAKTGTDFIDREGMLYGCDLSRSTHCPTQLTGRPHRVVMHGSSFFNSKKKSDSLKLIRQTQVVQVHWLIDAPQACTRVVVEPSRSVISRHIIQSS